MNIKKNAVVILGAGIMQIPAIKAAEESGFSTIVFDGNPEPAGKNNAEIFYNVDIKDYEKIIKKCSNLKDQYNVKGVFTAGTDFSYIVALIAEEMNLPGISYETALKATVKSKMRKAFSDFQVNSPLYFVAGNDFKIEKTEHNLSFPLVVKPVDSMGGRGSVKIDSDEDLEKAVENAVEFSRTGKAIIEEYIEGAEFSLDAVIEQGSVKVCGLADRHIFFPPYFIEMGHTMPSNFPDEVQKKVYRVFEDGINALGIKNGTAKGDIKYTGEKAVIGEIAARLSGGYMSGWTFPYASGISVIKAAINIAVGKPSGLKPYKYINTAAERAFISIPGKVSKVIIPDYLEEGNRADEIKDIFINVREGERVVFPKNNVQKCGNVIAVHKNRETAVIAAEKSCRDIIVRLECCDMETEEFLFNKTDDWIPDAFHIKYSKNIEAFHGMDKIKIPDNYSGKSKIAVSMIPFPEKEKLKDWQGRSFSDSFDNVLLLSGAEVELKGKEYRAVLGKVFWDAFTCGGIQGGLWIIETIDRYLAEGDLPERFL